MSKAQRAAGREGDAQASMARALKLDPKGNASDAF